MKHVCFIQHDGMNVNLKDIEGRVRSIWREKGNLMKDISRLELYVKPEEKRVYFVINEIFTGSVSLEE
ncbi:DUF6465 family protein [Exiguobacterium sp. s163]|uniref:DUF6465 family protein n=1 Tax=unclassified Exiguobacterium TaxID=2644629 RepID=UPI00333B4B86